VSTSTLAKSGFFVVQHARAPDFEAELDAWIRQDIQVDEGFEWTPEVGMAHLQNSSLLPVALKLWTMPASSAPCERVFSLMGRIDTLSRSLLTEEHLEHYTFIKANKDL